jgi:hypothetical protein
MDMATALAELGATGASLDAQTAERLDRDGYAALPAMLSAQLTVIRARLADSPAAIVRAGHSGGVAGKL